MCLFFYLKCELSVGSPTSLGLRVSRARGKVHEKKLMNQETRAEVSPSDHRRRCSKEHCLLGDHRPTHLITHPILVTPDMFKCISIPGAGPHGSCSRLWPSGFRGTNDRKAACSLRKDSGGKPPLVGVGPPASTLCDVFFATSYPSLSLTWISLCYVWANS